MSLTCLANPLPTGPRVGGWGVVPYLHLLLCLGHCAPCGDGGALPCSSLLPPSPPQPTRPPTPICLLWSLPRSVRTVQDKVLWDTDHSPMDAAICKTSLARSGHPLRIRITSAMPRLGSQVLTLDPLTRCRNEVFNFSSYGFILICIRNNITCVPNP